MNMGYEFEDELKPYVEPKPDLKDPKRIGKTGTVFISSTITICVLTSRLILHKKNFCQSSIQWSCMNVLNTAPFIVISTKHCGEAFINFTSGTQCYRFINIRYMEGKTGWNHTILLFL